MTAEWSNWSNWSDCNCESNEQTRDRVCNRFDNAGDTCDGEDTETKSCISNNCAGGFINDVCMASCLSIALPMHEYDCD